MNKKYELLKTDILTVPGGSSGIIVLHRIKALKDFDNVKKGDIGGYIEKEDNLSHDGNCWVFDNAWVSDNAKVYDNALVFGNALVFDNAMVYGNARVFDYAQVYDGANVKSNDDYALVQCFGSQNRTTTFYRTKDNSIGVVCGCFDGTLDEFKSKVKETHGNTYLAEEYLDIANLMEKRFKNRYEKEK